MFIILQNGLRHYSNCLSQGNATTVRPVFAAIAPVGPFRPGETVAKQVFVPATLEYWATISGYQEWVQVPLKALFEGCK